MFKGDWRVFKEDPINSNGIQSFFVKGANNLNGIRWLIEGFGWFIKGFEHFEEDLMV